jgi:hypothetical protein
MDQERWSAIASVVAALIVLLASNKQWWTVSYNGRLVTRLWAQRMLIAVAGWLITALALLVVSVSEETARLVFVVGVALSLFIAWPLGSFFHARAVRLFGQRHPEDGPLAGGSF